MEPMSAVLDSVLSSLTEWPRFAEGVRRMFGVTGPGSAGWAGDAQIGWHLLRHQNVVSLWVCTETFLGVAEQNAERQATTTVPISHITRISEVMPLNAHQMMLTVETVSGVQSVVQRGLQGAELVEGPEGRPEPTGRTETVSEGTIQPGKLVREAFDAESVTELTIFAAQLRRFAQI